LENYFSGPINHTLYIEPFRTTNTIGKWSGILTVIGGGQKSQLQAVILAFSRCLVKYDSERFRPILRKRGFLTRDPRVKERKKPGLMGARKKKQSPKR
jgi:small subunit ribosomal protein S9